MLEEVYVLDSIPEGRLIGPNGTVWEVREKRNFFGRLQKYLAPVGNLESNTSEVLEGEFRNMLGQWHEREALPVLESGLAPEMSSLIDGCIKEGQKNF